MSVTSIILILGVSIFGGKNSDPLPSRDQIESIESRLRLPGDAPAPLSQYQRYYAWTVDNGRKYIIAVYIFDGLVASRPPDGGSRIHSVMESDIPNVTNGGCGVITFYVDPRVEREPSLYCNAVGPAAFSKN